MEIKLDYYQIKAVNGCIKLFQPKVTLSSFEKPLIRIEELFKDPNQLLDVKKSSELRIKFFELEGMARVFSKVFEIEKDSESKQQAKENQESAKKLEDLRTTFKEIENALGKYSFPFEIEEQILKVKTHPRLQKYISQLEILVEYYKQEQTIERQNLLKYLKSSGWYKHAEQMITNIRNTLESIPWGKKKEIRGQILLSLKKSLKETQELFPRDPSHPKKDELDPKILEEGGSHKARRLLRWFSIYFSALHYYIEYEGLPNEKIKTYIMDSSLVDSKFSVIEPSEIKGPILIPKEFILILNSWIARLGKAKDWGTLERAMAHGLSATKIVSPQREAQAFASETACVDKLSEMVSELSIRELDNQGLLVSASRQLSLIRRNRIGDDGKARIDLLRAESTSLSLLGVKFVGSSAVPLWAVGG
ncbi:MAG: hypothetical protein AABY64_11340 [Bdellovibrionota bacterium]